MSEQGGESTALPRSVPNATVQEVAGARVVIAVGKKKTAIAKAVVRPGIGRVRVNGIPIEIWPIEMARMRMMEPLLLAGKELTGKVDIDVTVRVEASWGRRLPLGWRLPGAWLSISRTRSCLSFT